MVIWNSLISFSVVIGFFIYNWMLPEDTATYEYAGLAFFAFPFFAVASVLSLIALIVWVKKIRRKEYVSYLQYLAIAPSIPMFLTWVLVSIFLIKVVVS